MLHVAQIRYSDMVNARNMPTIAADKFCNYEGWLIHCGKSRKNLQFEHAFHVRQSRFRKNVIKYNSPMYDKCYLVAILDILCGFVPWMISEAIRNAAGADARPQADCQ
jgi:hypothetical protein